MVKFGRHLEFYQHNELRDHALYVVPYNDIKVQCISSYAEREAQQQQQQQQQQHSADDEKKDEGAEAEQAVVDAYFCRQKFKTDWRSCLAMASRDFERYTHHFWSTVFDGIIAASSSGEGEIDPDEIRGALPDTALRLYLQIATDEQVQELYTSLKDIHSTALINSEALRKLVKKFDKEQDKACAAAAANGADAAVEFTTTGGDGNNRDALRRADSNVSSSIDGESSKLSGRLLPEVYSANFTVGLPTVEAGLEVVRQHLGLDDEEDEDDLLDVEMSDVQAARIKFLSMDRPGSPAPPTSPLAENAEDLAGFFGLTLKRSDSDAILVEKRKSELRYLRSLVESLRVASESEENNGGIDLIGCLVGHRGFHSIKDRSDKRPLENSLMAYEAAWTNGIHLCECDIVLTRDDRIVLAHDENFVRLALDPSDPLVQRQVTDLTYKEIISLPLKSGSRPPLLFDVLRSAHAIGGEARMIVEIKPGNCEAGTALAKMFARHPQLMERCAAVMSFDAFAMQNLRRELGVVFPSLDSVPNLPSPRSKVQMLQSSPSEDMLPLTMAPPLHHGHRRGVSVGGTVIAKIPTAMSIGDMHNVAAAALAVEGPGKATTTGMDERARTDCDQLGMSLESTGMGVRKDSFRFTPFGQLGRVPSFQGGGTLIPPLNQLQAHAHKPLETIPGGQRVEDATPHPIATTVVVIPKLLLITRNGPAQNEEQKDALQVDVSNPSDLSRASAWLQCGSPCERLDGLYMQFQPYMIDSTEGMEAMRTLTDHFAVGIWGANPKRDDFDTFHRLVKDCGISYFNTGLPKKFFKHMRRGSGGGSGGRVKSTAEENMEINSRTWPRQPQPSSSGHLGLPW